MPMDIRALGSQPRCAGAQQKYAIGGIGQIPPDHHRGEFGGFGGIPDRSHLVLYLAKTSIKRAVGHSQSASDIKMGCGNRATPDFSFPALHYRVWFTVMILIEPPISFIQISPLPIMTPRSRANRLSGLAAATASLISGVKTRA
jgi:hypothetical protein